MTASTTREVPAVRSAGATAALAVAIAAALSIVVLVAARLAGADMVVQPPGQEEMTIGVAHVIVTTLVAGLVGGLVLFAVGNRSPRAWRGVAAAGLTLGLVSAVLPFTIDATTGTRLALATMHIAAGISWFAVLGSVAPTERRVH